MLVIEVLFEQDIIHRSLIFLSVTLLQRGLYPQPKFSIVIVLVLVLEKTMDLQEIFRAPAEGGGKPTTCYKSQFSLLKGLT